MSNDIISTNIYDKRDDFDFKIVHFLFLIAMFLVLHPIVYISHLFVLLVRLVKLVTRCFARVRSVTRCF